MKTKYHLCGDPSGEGRDGATAGDLPGSRPVTRTDATLRPGSTRTSATRASRRRRPAPSLGPARRRATAGGTVYYENCDAARAAGAAPVHRGDPGYGAHLDRDGDGSACE